MNTKPATVKGSEGAELKGALVLVENASWMSMLKTGRKGQSQEQGAGT